MPNFPLSTEVVYDKTVNYATQQNNVPVIKKLVINNNEEKVYKDVKIKIEAEPEFCLAYESSIELLNSKETIDLGSIDIRLSPKFLANLDEKVSGFLKLTVESSEELLLNEMLQIDVLAFDEWNGFSVVPEIIAAFVTPNQKSIPKILKAASEVLGKASGNPSLDGYQSRNPQRTLNQLAAIYKAIQAMNITYSNPPASYEEIGQKVRFPDTIYEQRLGTCLDTTLLYAACAEAVGINSLVLFAKGHAYVGFWLIDETFAECIQDDFTVLTKRIAQGINEICVVETTLLTAGKDTSFAKACEAAEESLYTTDGFHFLVDIKRCRMSSIKPLPLIVNENNLLIADETEELKAEKLSRQEIVNIDTVEDYSSVKSYEEKKLDEWQRRLLDLSLRNSLLNFRISSSGVPLISPQLHVLEDALSEGESFKILSKPEEWEVTARDIETFNKRNEVNPIIKLLNEEFNQKRLRSFLPQGELNTRLTQLYRSARASLEENGANTLYLAMGFLVWFETPSSEKPRFAPIILEPVEMIRKSIQSGYSIRTREEEPQLNITLIEMLKQDFGIDASSLYPLPRDEHGVDVKKVFAKLRKIIMHMSKWDVIDECHLGLFSFSKFVMWNDLKVRSKELKKNKVVSSLMSGRLAWLPEQIVTDYLDKKYAPKDIFCPISADSSQLNAIVSAADNKSFVLHGPPGTGKSQTITNIIANALGNGKTVLFVAEKMAALSVVQNRLSQIGLEPFCLELYSNKAKKKDVLEQFKKASEIVKINPPDSFAVQSDKLAVEREKLNKYVEVLHAQRSIGHSIYNGISQYTNLKQLENKIQFEKDKVKNISKENFEVYKDLVHKLAVAAQSCGEPSRSPYLGIEREEYSIALKEETIELSGELIKLTESLNISALDIEKDLGFSFNSSSYKVFNRVFELCEKLMARPQIEYSALLDKNLQGIKEEIEALTLLGEKRDKLRLSLLSRFEESVLTLDIKNLLGEIRNANSKWFLPKLLGQNRVLKLLMGYVKAGVKIDRGLLQSEIELMDEINTLQGKLNNASSEIKNYFRLQWNNSFADWQELKKACEFTLEVHKAVKDISSSLELPFKESMSSIINLAENNLEEGSSTGKKITSYLEIKKTSQLIWSKLKDQLSIGYEIYIRESSDKEWLTRLKQKLKDFIAGGEGLRDYCNFVRSKNEALKAQLSNVVTPLIEGRIKSEELEVQFLKGFYRAWLEAEIIEEKDLSQFARSNFEDMIKSFSQLDDNFAYLTQAEVYARLSSKVPNMTEETIASSEPGILQKAIRSQGRGMSIRKLFDSIPNLLTRLTPCILMSPISVAQYLDPAFPQFDLVVFDEASQMPTCEAIGAMARGKNVIIVGDPNQLPPTSFFSTQTSSEEEDIGIKDMESILDDCLSLNIPQLHLLWHYRSRHESLIAFSNKEYYDNKLITFPSPDDLVSKVSFKNVKGIYDRGRTKHNRQEAEAIVEEIFRRLKDSELSKKSIGVVTFNTIQQGLIQDMIDEKLKEYPEFEKYFSDEMAEPIFVKNLENVQGDERDIILFSIGYGPDKEGKVTMNFGPLNRDGGWRRLNVAASRARCEMVIFSSLKAEDINLSRTNAKGVIGLRDFLEYAEKGRKNAASNISGKSAEVGYLSQIAEALRGKGYRVSENLGSSGYKIDLAVAYPDNENEFVLAIQGDGANYAKAQTARDRDKLRELVLKQLGWNILKVWAMDYYENPTREIERIETEIKKLLKESKPIEAFKQPVIKTFMPKQDKSIGLVSGEYKATDQGFNRKRVYQEAVLKSPGLSSEDFYSTSSDGLIMNDIKLVIEQEAPISKTLLIRKVIVPWGITRSGARIEARIGELCSRLKVYALETDTSVFYWQNKSSIKTFDYYRVPENDTSKRSAEDIPQLEYVNAMMDILEKSISLPEDTLIKETAKLFGYQRVGTTLDTALRNAIKYAVKKGIIKKKDNGNYVLQA